MSQNQNSHQQLQQQNRIAQKQNSNQKPTSETGLQQQIQFQKNYPKNIFIPLLQYLNQRGYKSKYQTIIGTRDAFQGKNVVSLGEIFLLISEEWFITDIDKQKALVYVSNRILINSKIKKKLFHLLMSREILESYCKTLKDFKRKLSKAASNISKRAFKEDEAFEYSNIIIYLLNTFLKKIKEFRPLRFDKEEEIQLNHEIQLQQKCKNQTQSSKQQYKMYVKAIVQMLNFRHINIQILYDIYVDFNEIITKKENQFRQKYGLNDNVPNWIPFAYIICFKCIEFKKKGTKITNFLFNEWINQYKTYATMIYSSNVDQESQENCQESQQLEVNADLEVTKSKLACTSIMQNLPCFSKRYRREPQTLKVTASLSKQFRPILISCGKRQQQ